MVKNQNCLPVSYRHGDYSQPVGFIPPCFADIVPNSCFVPLNLMCLAVQAEKDISGQLSEGKWGESFSIKLASSASGFQASAHRCKDVTWCNTVPKKLRFKASNCLTVWHLYASKIRHKRHCGIALFFWSKPALCQVPTSFPTVLIWVQTRESPLFQCCFLQTRLGMHFRTTLDHRIQFPVFSLSLHLSIEPCPVKNVPSHQGAMANTESLVWSALCRSCWRYRSCLETFLLYCNPKWPHK